MRYMGSVILSGSVAASINGTAIDVSSVYQMSLQAAVVDSGTDPAGTLKVQVSNDNPQTGAPINWSDLSGATVAVAGGGAFLIAKFEVSYLWMRAVYTDSSSGTAQGTISVRAKSNGY